MVKILDDSDETVKIYCSEKNIRFEFNNVTFTSRLLEGDYIDYKKIIPSDYKTVVKSDVRPLIESVERASLIITGEFINSPVIMNIVDGEIKINCETQVGKVEEYIAVDMYGSGLEIGFNNRYLLDALKASEVENVKIEFNGATSGVLIKPTDNDEFLYMIMPMRLR